MAFTPDLIFNPAPPGIADSLYTAANRINANLAAIAEEFANLRPARVWNGSFAPTVNNDSGTGVGVGDHWRYAGGLWICSDATVGAAVWTKVLTLGVAAGTFSSFSITHTRTLVTSNANSSSNPGFQSHAGNLVMTRYL